VGNKIGAGLIGSNSGFVSVVMLDDDFLVIVMMVVNHWMVVIVLDDYGVGEDG
jgi:hypothetical protein